MYKCYDAFGNFVGIYKSLEFTINQCWAYDGWYECLYDSFINKIAPLFGLQKVGDGAYSNRDFNVWYSELNNGTLAIENKETLEIQEWYNIHLKSYKNLFKLFSHTIRFYR